MRHCDSNGVLSFAILIPHAEVNGISVDAKGLIDPLGVEMLLVFIGVFVVEAFLLRLMGAVSREKVFVTYRLDRLRV
jgi:hypothetical protein